MQLYGLSVTVLLWQRAFLEFNFIRLLFPLQFSLGKLQAPLSLGPSGRKDFIKLSGLEGRLSLGCRIALLKSVCLAFLNVKDKKLRRSFCGLLQTKDRGLMHQEIAKEFNVVSCREMEDRSPYNQRLPKPCVGLQQLC